ncbi:hypothetical protein [Burkholderia lata]|uniref:hypothetical protein n=1 Tax=Burkholderia lata (strain ATCC 17760 / DSM 23089 / LMG 22485 / NCIMB 9086 / R18194 / 383) TaxID=482957 RepID=UPI001582B8A3|nr:hypothetical protein [Burkholderia lata]
MLFLLEANTPRVAQQAGLLVEVAQRNRLPGRRNIGRSILLWLQATDETHGEAGKHIRACASQSRAQPREYHRSCDDGPICRLGTASGRRPGIELPV